MRAGGVSAAEADHTVVTHLAELHHAIVLARLTSPRMPAREPRLYHQGGKHHKGDGKQHQLPERVESRDPLTDPVARDGAVRDWRAWAKTTARLQPATINNTLAAIDDFYTRRGLGSATARREALPGRAPRRSRPGTSPGICGRWSTGGSTRNTVVALLPFYAGLRIGEVGGLDVTDVFLSARKGSLRVPGKHRSPAP